MKRMVQIAGTPLDRDDWPKYTWNADLVEFEGPLVSLYRTDDDRDALFIWVDASRATNRWCIVPVDRTRLAGYLTQQLALRDLIDAQQVLIVVNIGSTGRRTHALWVNRSALPAEYLPGHDSYLTDELATDAARRLVAEETKPYQVRLGGELYADDLTTLPKILSQLYAFQYGLAYIDRDAVRSRITEGMDSWTGGFDSVNLFSGLRSVIPSVHRMRVTGLEYHSPGHIEFNLLQSLLDTVRGDVERLADNQFYREAQDFYKNVGQYMREEGLSGFDDPSRRKSSFLKRGQKSQLTMFIAKFIDLMGWDAQAGALDSLNIDPLSKLRALLAYYRRLRQLRPLLQADKFSF